MPHYTDGQEAREGDVVKTKDYNGKEIVGRLSGIVPGAETCNGNVDHVVLATATARHLGTIGKMELVSRPD